MSGNQKSVRTSGQRPERGSLQQGERIARTESEDRGDRGYSEADLSRLEADGTMVTVSESNSMDFNEFQMEALPVPPKIPGWHFCWLSTTNSYDPIHKRVRMGYQPVKYVELPGFEVHKDSTAGQADGDVVRCNEMALYKIPMDKYLRIMKHFHHDEPRASEQAIRVKVEALQGEIGTDDKDRGLVTTEEGFKSIEALKSARFAAS